jgi:hypothetical protein
MSIKVLHLYVLPSSECCCVGIMVTAKKRQEFRIKLQKRARKLADKKIEAIEDEKQYKEVIIVNTELIF